MKTAILEKDTRSAILATGQAIMSHKGFSAVGLTEILTAAGVPKGSFYHYFASKDAFGEAMLAAYFEDYLGEIDAILARPGLTGAERLMLYFSNWRSAQGAFDCQGAAWRSSWEQRWPICPKRCVWHSRREPEGSSRASWQ
jgi:TetR/AcrR family transcriptional repressor of nem operon